LPHSYYPVGKKHIYGEILSFRPYEVFVIWRTVVQCNVSRILFANISKFLKWKFICIIMTFGGTHGNT
jgi:hypothetical protein